MVADEEKFQKESRIQEEFLMGWVSHKNEEHHDANANNEQVKDDSSNSSAEECLNDPGGKQYSKGLSDDTQNERPKKNSSTTGINSKIKDATLKSSSSR